MATEDTGAEGGEEQVDGGQPEDGQEGQQVAVDAQPERGERVELPKPAGRRAAAKAERDALTKQFEELKSTVTKRDEDYRRELATRDQEIARLRGGFEMVQPILQGQQRQQQQGPDPDEMDRQAQKALDGNDFNEYQRLTRAAMEARFERRLQAFQQQQAQQAQQTQQQQVHPALQVIQSQHWTVMSHPQGQAIAAAHDTLLAAAGKPASPARWKEAYELAEAQITGNQRQTQFTQQGASALAAAPQSRGGSGSRASDGPGVELSAHERMTADKAGMKYDEYAKYLAEAFPERVLNGRS